MIRRHRPATVRSCFGVLVLAPRADVTSDGAADICYSGTQLQTLIACFVNTGSLSSTYFSASATLVTSQATFLKSVWVGDVNGDSVADFVGVTGGTVSWYSGAAASLATTYPLFSPVGKVNQLVDGYVWNRCVHRAASCVHVKE